MNFKVIGRFSDIPKNSKSVGYLAFDYWNDYQYFTLYRLTIIDELGHEHSIGEVKIAHLDQGKGSDEIKVDFDNVFQKLDDQFFSLGQSEEYYSNLKKLGDEKREEILRSLRDIARNSSLFERVVGLEITQDSLFRTVSPNTVTGQFRRISQGGVRLTEYEFRFDNPRISEGASRYELGFNVNPESFPPTNVHVLIGRNGVGKTHLLNNMLESLFVGDGEKYGSFHINGAEFFANVIAVTFSAFDVSRLNLARNENVLSLEYSYIGLKKLDYDTGNIIPKNLDDLNDEFVKSLSLCASTNKQRWIDGISHLESDPNFKNANLGKLIDKKEDQKEEIHKIFQSLSSGHKIVLLTITRLIERLQEKSLVIMDEPEAHLHPPLLSAFIRALSELLILTNGVAIIATHSPVILQEVPKRCVWKLRRVGAEAIAERLEVETFGENVGKLTNEIFGLEVTYSGFYKIIQEVTKICDSYEEALDYFNGELGNEARAILMTYYT